MNPAVFLHKSTGTAYTSEQRRLLKATLTLGCNHSRKALFSGNATPPTKAGLKVGWLMPVILVCGRLRQVHQGVQGRLE